MNVLKCTQITIKYSMGMWMHTTTIKLYLVIFALTMAYGRPVDTGQLKAEIL